MGSSIGASRTVWAVLGVHSAESVPFAGRFAVRDLVDGLCLRRGSREDKHGKVAQHTIAVVAAFGSSLPTVGTKPPPARCYFPASLVKSKNYYLDDR